ncbi:MAG: helicase-exonuclease AddAB subunit AddA [Clostridia bacterium]|nr:helicase-exonuclease AddAB subunit AddA [Clostridia bacterium]
MAERQWTKEQLDAINAESGTVLVSAAAGSGKTSVLVERIVRKLTDTENPVYPDSLLVVTFTKAAAGEMRSRIFNRISEKRDEQPQRHNEYIKLLSRLDEMNISTMDSFCMGLVKENFSLCGISPDFTVLEAGEAKLLKKQVLADTVQELYLTDEENFVPLTKLFEQGLSDDNLLTSIERLSDFSMSQPAPLTWLDSVADNFLPLSAADSVWGKILIANAEETLKYCIQLCDDAIGVASNEEELEKTIGAAFSANLERLSEFSDKFLSFSWDGRITALEKLIADIGAAKFRAPNGYSDNPCKTKAYAKRDEYKKLLGKMLDLLNISEAENKEDVDVLRPLAKEIIKATKLFNSRLLERKKEDAAFEFADITHFALGLLYDENAEDKKTELARSLSLNFSEILIDEYQDTSRAQDTLFTCLSKNGENMFMVGDVKQSIYRFRLASPEIFIEKSESFPYYDGKAKKSKIILSKNFRSRKGIVEGVNFLFDSLLSKECGEIEYNDDEKLNYASSFPESDTPDVNLYLIPSGEMKPFEAEAVYIARIIKRKILGGELVADRGVYRKCAPGDFCILLRSAKGMSSVFASALKKEGLNVSVDSGEDFFSRTEIKMIMSFLYVLDNPARDVHMLSLLLSPLFGFSPDEAADIKLNARKCGLPKNSSLFAAISAFRENEKCREFLDRLSFYRRLSVSLSVGELVEKIYDDFSLTCVALSMADGEQRKNNLLQFSLLAHSFSESTKKGLGAFVRRMDAYRENGVDMNKSAASASKDSVSVMTMHRSKGLEFPFVFIAGLDKKFFTSDLNSTLCVSNALGLGIKRQESEKIKVYDTLSSLAVRSQLKAEKISEELRIHYVALTRAKEKLHIVIALDNIAKKLTDIGELLTEERNIPPVYVRNVVSPSVWYLASFMRHKDAAVMRISADYTVKSDFPLNVNIVEDIEETQALEEIKQAAAYNRETLERIKQNIRLDYEYLPVSRAFSKYSASALHSQVFSSEYFAKTVPAFMNENKITPADKGTATHRFLQFCDFAVCKTEPEKERDRLLRENKLSELFALNVDMESIRTFFNSSVTQRIEKAEAVYREKQFTLSKSICELDSTIPKEFADEKTVIVGKIDLIFIEDGQAVILDYKTDNVNNVDILAKRYAEQLDLYSEAVEKALNIKVKERILYSLTLKEYVNV